MKYSVEKDMMKKKKVLNAAMIFTKLKDSMPVFSMQYQKVELIKNIIKCVIDIPIFESEEEEKANIEEIRRKIFGKFCKHNLNIEPASRLFNYEFDPSTEGTGFRTADDTEEN